IREAHSHLWIDTLAHRGRREPRRAVRRSWRQLDVGAEAAIVLVVIVLHDDAAIRELGLEVEAIAAMKGADDRLPVGAVWVNAPDAPVDAAVQTLRFERAEDDAPVSQHDRMQRPGHVEMADLFDIATVLTHDVELQRVLRIAARRLDG